MGVDPELTPTTEAEALRLGMLIAATQGRPDDDSRALTAALLESGLSHPDLKERALAQKRFGLGRAICRHLVGDKIADELAIPRARERLYLPPAIATIRAIEHARKRSRIIEDELVRRGERYWDFVLKKGLLYATVDFSLPSRLAT
jgi:hypothetical protein